MTFGSTELSSAQRTEIELIARGKQQKSRTLRELNQAETSEAAHALLLKLGIWPESRTPYAERLHVATEHLSLPVPDFAEEKRLDLTHLPAFAIDDEGNKDPDDAISLEVLPDGLYRLWVHVADVAALVPPESDLDQAARSRGATLYLPDETIGMLPDALVQKTGLGLHETMPALSVMLDLDEEGNAEAIDVHLTQVKVTRITYLQAQERLDAGEEPFVTLQRLARASQDLRNGEGALQINLPEVRVKIEDDQVIVSKMSQPEMRFVVQECMTLAGWGAAIFADDNELSIPFATQDPPTREVYGDDLPAQWARRKTLGRTRFQPSPAPHSGMGLDLYTQVTSPMRRYLDLVVHQQLRSLLCEQETLSSTVISQHMAQAQLNANSTRQAERASRKHHVLRYVAMQPEHVWEAIIVDKRGPKATLLIPELALDVAMSTPASLGSEVKIQLLDINLPHLSARAKLYS